MSKIMALAGRWRTANYEEREEARAELLSAVQELERDAERLTDEQDRALCEAFCNAASDEYFAARPALDFPEMRRIFYAGHRKAWITKDAAIAAREGGAT